MQTLEWARKAREASYKLAAMDIKQRNEALAGIRQALKKHANEIFEQNALDLSQAQACDWITGLSLPCDNAPGWCLVCVDGCSLGFGKVSGGVCKNHYPKGLRRKTVAI